MNFFVLLMNLFKKISSKNIKEGLNLEDLNNKNTDEHDVAQVVPRQIRKEEITYDAILQHYRNPERQVQLVRNSDMSVWSSLKLVDHCGGDRATQIWVCRQMAQRPVNRRHADRKWLQAFERRGDIELLLYLLGATEPISCCCICNDAHLRKGNFNHEMVRAIVVYILTKRTNRRFDIRVFASFTRYSFELRVAFQLVYIWRTDDFEQIAANINAILRECVSEEVKALARQRKESFDRSQALLQQPTAMTPLLLRQTDPNYVSIPGAVPEDVSAGYFQLAADASRQSTNDKDKDAPSLATRMQLASGTHNAHQEPRMFASEFQSDSR
jgi:hypothetical protein